MTLSISALTPEGIVLTADSRQTYKNLAQTYRTGTDNANKLFQLTKKTGVVISGRAFALDDKGNLKNIGWFIEQFKKNNLKKGGVVSVKEIRDQLTDYLKNKNINGVLFIVAGYESDGTGKAYIGGTDIPADDRLSRDTNTGGFLRVGQDEVVSRVMHGWANQLKELDFVKKAQSEGVDVVSEFNKATYQINWGTIAMQDAIDFCVLMTRMSASVQRFSDGTILNPGDIPGIGGPIDVATITPEEDFTWLSKKELRVDDKT